MLGHAAASSLNRYGHLHRGDAPTNVDRLRELALEFRAVWLRSGPLRLVIDLPPNGGSEARLTSGNRSCGAVAQSVRAEDS